MYLGNHATDALEDAKRLSPSDLVQIAPIRSKNGASKVGDSEFLIVDEAGMHPIELQAKTEHEDFVEIFDTYVPMVYQYAGDLAKSEEEVSTVLQAFTEALMSQRSEFREKREKIERLKANIKRIQESKS